MTIRTYGVSLLAVCALGALFVGCGGTSSRGSGPSGCVIADVSGSTGEARDAYAKSFSAFAKRIGTSGSGNICVVLTAGDPQAEAPLARVYVGSDAHVSGIGGESLSPENRILLAVRKARKQFEEVMAEPAVGDPGSALVEAAVVAARGLKPGDELLYLSDGIENSPAVGNFLTADLSPASRERMLDRLERAGLIPDLEGVHVSFPFLLYHPGGLGIAQEREVAIRLFWQAWAARAKATLGSAAP